MLWLLPGVAGATVPAAGWSRADVANAESGVLVGDFNGDTYDDLLVRDRGDATSRVYPGALAGLGAQPSRVYAFPAHGPESLVADLNGDACDDVVLVDDYELAVYYGSSAGLVEQWPHAYPTLDGFRKVAKGDVDADGFDDLVFTLYDSAAGVHTAYWWRGGSNGLQLAPSWSQPTGTTNGDVGVFDANGDGYGDLALGGGPSNAGTIAIFLGGPAGPIAPAWSAVNTPALHADFGVHFAAGGDLDGDGREDLVAAAFDTNLGVWSFIFVAGGVASVAAPVVTTGVDPNRPVLRVFPDADGDGDDELLVGLSLYSSGGQTERGVAAVLKLTGSNRFGMPVAGDFAMGSVAFDHAGVAIGAGDFDGSGRPDFVTSSPGAGVDGRVDAFYDVP